MKLKSIPMIPISKFIFFLALFFSAITTQGQSVDTIWFDRAWKPTNDSQLRHFFRTVKSAPNAIYEVTDHYANGTVQMHGFYSSIKPEIKSGEFTYFTEKGVLQNK